MKHPLDTNLVKQRHPLEYVEIVNAFNNLKGLKSIVGKTSNDITFEYDWCIMLDGSSGRIPDVASYLAKRMSLVLIGKVGRWHKSIKLKNLVPQEIIDVHQAIEDEQEALRKKYASMSNADLDQNRNKLIKDFLNGGGAIYKL